MTAGLAFYGDSTEYGLVFDKDAGLYLPAPSEYTPSDVVAAAFPEVQVSNGSASGATATDLYWGKGVCEGAGCWFDRMAADPSQLVIINVGLNDMVRDDAPGQFEANLAAMVDTAHGFDKQVILETPNPTTFADVSDIAQQIRDVAHDHGAGLIDQTFNVETFMPDWKDHLPDGIHPDDSMYHLKGIMDTIALSHAGIL